MNETLSCKHAHTQLIAKDKDAEYVECLDCGAILEASERPDPAKRETTNVDGSLSDA